jgi:hypothetical protein
MQASLKMNVIVFLSLPSGIKIETIIEKKITPVADIK